MCRPAIEGKAVYVSNTRTNIGRRRGRRGSLSTCLLRSNEIMRPKKRSLVVFFYGYGFTVAVMLDRQQVSRWLIHDAGGVLANLTKINHTFAITVQTVCRRFPPECFFPHRSKVGKR